MQDAHIARPAGDAEHPGHSAQPNDDPNRQDPNARPDLIAERRNAGAEDLAEAPGDKP